MKQYKLTDEEARTLAREIALSKERFSNSCPIEEWFAKYMGVYNRVMNAVDTYHQSIED